MTGIPFPAISPEIFSFEIFGFTLALRWYALAYIVGILLGWRLIRAALDRPHLWRDDRPPMDRAQLESLMTWIILGVILGGRIGYVVFYQPAQYLADPLSILRVWQGGMAFHGGFLGVVLAVFLFTRSQRIPLAPVADVIALATPLGLLLGRTANFVNAELWGRVTEVPWGVVFCNDALRDPASGLCVAGDLPRHPSQLYEAGLEGLILGLVLLYLAFRRGALKRHWLLTGVFFAGYGASRFVVEFFRQPDAQFVTPGNPLGLAWHVDGWGLTMGQILSLPMVIVGLAAIGFALRRR